MIHPAKIAEILRTKAYRRLFHREGQDVEFKEQHISILV